MDFLRRNAVAIIFIIALALFAWDSHTKVEDAKVKAHHDAIAVRHKAFELAVDSCRRVNPTNAFILLRAVAIPKSKDQDTEYTRKIAPKVYQLLDCSASVTQQRPVPLNKASARKYLLIFSHNRVPITRGQKIVASVDFKTYFEGWKNP